MNIGEIQRSLSSKAERSPEHRFDDLFGLVCHMNWLGVAHDHVAANSGSITAGCDGINMSDFDDDLENNLLKIQTDLKSGTFVAKPVRRVSIPKGNGKIRPLGIPSIRDRIVQEAVRMILEPIYEADFSQQSYGFRSNRSTMHAIKYITYSATENKRFLWVIEGDISSYFDTINHRKLMKLLGRRIEDERLLKLIWTFLRAGVMERKLFRDTNLGTPQGGIISPLLANVYLHELDKYMQRYTALTTKEKATRRRHGLANFAYARYADDFVVLTNGTKVQAMQMKEELNEFLSTTLRLKLSMEKTKVTHLNEGFEFLGFELKRSMCATGIKTRLLIPKAKARKHLDKIKEALDPSTHEDSLTLKIVALNRIISGWCRYYQHTSKLSIQLSQLEYKTFWLMIHWLGRKYQISTPTVLRRFYAKGLGLGTTEKRLIKHDSFKRLTWKKGYLMPNPYTTMETIKREDISDQSSWTGYETRPGWADIRLEVLQRDAFTCGLCKNKVTHANAQVDHLLPYSHYKRPVDANRPENLWTLCEECHKRKTQRDRRMESRMQ
jgi:group II intron reverse transcriptase/maturase